MVIGLRAFLLCALASAAAAHAAPVPVSGGLVDGTTASDGITAYKGIPFAAPPTGELRWRAPRPVPHWNGVRRATAFAPSCPQDQGANARLGLPVLPTSEDCLYLNVWTPPHAKGAKLPVMVWIYGGGFIYGGTGIPTYDGAALARQGVIVVSIAYRLGALGFLAHPELSAESGHGSGNYAMLDQIAGLRWVHDNIARFGGDPDQVTIWGESAGGIAAHILTVSPLARGLFQRVIVESGVALQPLRRAHEAGSVLVDLPTAEAQGRQFLAKIGAASVAEARTKPADLLVANTDALGTGQFAPVIDRHVLPDEPYRLYAEGRYAQVPVLVGTNGDEGALFVARQSAAGHRAAVRDAYGAHADAILAAYPAQDDAQALRSARDLARDAMFAWPTWAWAKILADDPKAKAFVYYFDHRSPYPAVPAFKDWGAAHAAELPYVFGTLDTRPEMAWTGTERSLSAAMQRYWVNFAKTGNPNAPDLPAWPAFSASAPKVMRFTDRPEAGPVPNLDKLQVLDAYFAARRTGK